MPTDQNTSSEQPNNSTPTDQPIGAGAVLPPSQSASKKRFGLTKKKLLILAAVLLLGGGAFAYWQFFMKDSEGSDGSSFSQTDLAGKDLPLKDNLDFADKFLPDYSDMRGYADTGGEHWYASFKSIIVTQEGDYRVYNQHQFDGLSSFTGVMETDDQIWISGQGGVARYQHPSDTFKTYLKGEANTALFVDPFDGTLYAATFGTTYVYDKQADEFKPMEGAPRGVRTFGFTKNHVISTAPNHNENNNPVQLYNKQSKQWSVPSSLQYFAAGKRSSEVDQITVDGQVITYGRHVNYQSCEQEGQYPATVIYQLKDDGSFEELKDLQAQFAKNEAHGYAYSRTALRGSGSCNGDGSDAFVVDLKVDNGKVAAANKRALDYDNGFAFYTYADRVDQLEKEIGFAPKTAYVHATADGSVFSVWHSSRAKSLVSTNGAYKNVDRRASFSTNGSVFSYVECAGGQYVIESSGKTGDFTQPFLLTIQKIESSSPTEVYKTQNEPLYESVAAEFFMANSEGICVDDNIVLLGTNKIGVFDPAAKKLTPQDLGNTTSMELSTVNKARTEFNFVDVGSRQFVRVGKDAAQKKAVTFANNVLSSSETNGTKLYVFNDNHVVLAQSDSKQEGSHKLVTFKAQDGTVVKNSALSKVPSDGIEYDSERFVLQYDDGETKLINAATHEDSTISKSGSIIADDSFPIIKDSNSEFIVSDGHVWFTAQHWGVIGYKVS